MAMKPNNGGVKMRFYSLQRLSAERIILQEEKIRARKAERELFEQRINKYKEREM
jgi:hypothetical protein